MAHAPTRWAHMRNGLSCPLFHHHTCPCGYDAPAMDLTVRPSDVKCVLHAQGPRSHLCSGNVWPWPCVPQGTRLHRAHGNAVCSRNAQAPEHAQGTPLTEHLWTGTGTTSTGSAIAQPRLSQQLQLQPASHSSATKVAISFRPTFSSRMRLDVRMGGSLSTKGSITGATRRCR